MNVEVNLCTANLLAHLRVLVRKDHLYSPNTMLKERGTPCSSIYVNTVC